MPDKEIEVQTIGANLNFYRQSMAQNRSKY